MERAIPHYTTYSSSQRRGAAGRRGGAATVRKRTVKYLSVCQDPAIYKSIVKNSPDSVIKSICDAALNVQRGDRISLSKKQKTLFRRHSAEIDKLASKNIALSRKRKVLTQRGGAFFIPALIGAAISGLGSLLFGGNKT